MTKFITSLNRNKAETSKLRKRAKRQPYHKDVLYLDTNFKRIAKKIKSGDTIEFFGHGVPWSIGGVDYNDKYDRSPFTLAQEIANLLGAKTEITLTVDLMACMSGTIAKNEDSSDAVKDVCFARDLSLELSRLGYANISVYGYKGALNENFKSVGPPTDRRGKEHARLEEARVIYKRGKLIQEAQKDTVGDYDFTNNEIPEEMRKGYELLRQVSDKALKVIPANMPSLVLFSESLKASKTPAMSLQDANAEAKENTVILKNSPAK